MAGYLQINSSPSGASIWLNGTDTQIKTNDIIGSYPGSNVVALKLAGYHDWSQAINFIEGQTLTLNVTLTPLNQPPPTTNNSWLYLAGLGLLGLLLFRGKKNE